MKEVFETVFNNYIKDKNENKSATANLKSVYALQTEAKNKLSKLDFLCNNKRELNTEKYEIKGSAGSTNFATIPWIAIYFKTETDSAQRGIYIVYLFNKNCDKVYLTLNQGSTSIGKYYSREETSNILDKTAAFWRNALSPYNNGYFKENNDINLDDDQCASAKDYKDGTIIYKEYTKNNLPENDQIYDDLNKMLEIYEHFVDIRLHLFDQDFFENKKTKAENGKFTVSPITEDLKFHNFETPLGERYIKSLLAKQFVILTGNSGTGKTNIAKNFAKYLEKKDDKGNKNYLVKAVGADWTDNSKVLGYFNPIANNGTGDYVATDILNLIINANNNSGIPFFLILDEMNLSHVERYFSDFLSAMESKEEIILYKKPDGCTSKIPETISIPDNLFITGTVNIDETTYMFSPKVLDRANVIEFIPDEESIFAAFHDNSIIDKKLSIKPAAQGKAELFLKISRDIKKIDQIKFEEDFISILKTFNKELKTAGFDFAYRTIKEIIYYYKASKTVHPKITDSQILDEQIVQKILPKIHGNKKQLGDLLTNLEKLCVPKDTTKENIDGTGWKLGDDLSLTKIQSMKNKLDKYQYASFI